MSNEFELCHKTEKCTNVHVQIVVKIQKSLLNQNQIDLYIVKNVYQNTENRIF